MSLPDVLDQPSVTAVSNAALQALTKHILTSGRIACLRAAAHLREPARFPMPKSRSSYESVFLKGFQALPAKLQDQAKRNYPQRMRQLSASSSGVLIKQVDLEKPIGAAQQLLQLNPQRLFIDPGVLAEHVAGSSGRPRPPTSQPEAPQITRLHYRLHKVTCFDETSDWGTTNEMECGVVMVEPDGRVRRSRHVDLGEFSDLQTKSFSTPRKLGTFDLHSGGDAWPKRFGAIFVLAETDVYNIDGFLAELAEQVREDIVAALRGEGLSPTNTVQDVARYLEIAGEAIGGLPGEILSIVAALISFFASIFDNEIFDPRVSLCSVRGFDVPFNSTGRMDTNDRDYRFEGHGGLYGATTDWLKSAA